MSCDRRGLPTSSESYASNLMAGFRMCVRVCAHYARPHPRSPSPSQHATTQRTIRQLNTHGLGYVDVECEGRPGSTMTVLLLSPGVSQARPSGHTAHSWWWPVFESTEWKYPTRHERHMVEPSTLPDPMPFSASQSRHVVEPKSIAKRPDTHMVHDGAPEEDLRSGVSMSDKRLDQLVLFHAACAKA